MMTIAKHIAIHYGLLILAVFGVVETLRLLSTAWQDMKALSSAGVNGPRREVVLMRIYQSAFLLAVFGLFLSGGARVAMAKEYELLEPLTVTLILMADVSALLLLAKQFTMRRSRRRLDAYHDEMFPTKLGPFAHRRSTDTTEWGK
jgi:hypothetical protein